MKKGAIAVFVKTPGHSELKTRLGKTIGKENAERFHIMSVKATEEVLNQACQSKDINLTPYWAVAEESALKSELWNGFEKIWQGYGDLGDRLSKVYSELLDRYDYVLLLGADSPQLDASTIIDAAKTSARTNDFVMGPATDGGFYLMAGGKKVSHLQWKTVPYSTDKTEELLCIELSKIGKIRKLPPLTDIDTIEELKALKEKTSIGSGNKKQRELFDWLANLT